MKLIDLTVNDFCNEVDSKSPAPGGGSVSALASALGVSLTKMVGHLSVGKKKFKALDEEIQNQFKEVIVSFDKINVFFLFSVLYQGKVPAKSPLNTLT